MTADFRPPDLVDGVRLFRGTAADAADVTSVAVAADLADQGEADYDEAEAAADLAAPDLEWWLARDDSSRLLGYFWTGVSAGHTAVDVDVITDPSSDRELGPPLLDRAIARAVQRAPERPVHTFVPARPGRRAEWMAARGGRQIRRYSRMVIDFDDTAPAVPPLLPGVTVTRAPSTVDELRAVHHVVDGAFSDHFGNVSAPFEDWWPRQEARAGHDLRLWWLARVDGVPAAALIGRLMPDMGWVQALATLSEFRGRGLGTQLLRTAFAAMHARGRRRIGLGVDTANVTGALRLYESLGMRATLQWDAYELPAVVATAPSS